MVDFYDQVTVICDGSGLFKADGFSNIDRVTGSRQRVAVYQWAVFPTLRTYLLPSASGSM